MALQKIHQKVLERVEFIYLVSGHSYLPCDRTFGVIEKKLRSHGEIWTPDDYAAYIASSHRVPLTVVRMAITDFLKFSALDNYVKWKTPGNVRGAFQRARQLIVTSNYVVGYLVKLHYNLEDTNTNHFKVALSLGGTKGKGRGKGRSRGASARSLLDFDLCNVAIAQKYPGDAILINENKLKDLEHLLPYLDPEGHEWVSKVLEVQKSMQERGQGRSAEEEETDDLDPENRALDYEPVRCISDQ